MAVRLIAPGGLAELCARAHRLGRCPEWWMYYSSPAAMYRAAPVRRRLASRFVWLLACTSAVPVRLVAAQAGAATPGDTAHERLLQFGVGGGFAKVSSSPLSNTTFGYNLQGTVALRTPIRPLHLRVDGLFSDAGATRIEAFTASAVLAAPVRWAVAPYALAGGGGYAESGGRLTAGWNVGVGVSVPTGGRTRLYMESRVHAYRDALYGQPYIVPGGVTPNEREKYKYLLQPLSFGFRF